MRGPLDGVRVIELAAQGPVPFACMMLADLGAEVVAIERLDAARFGEDAHVRGRRSVAVDLKDPRGAELVLDIVAGSDVLVEGFRPGVTERLGIGPEPCLDRNPRLVYARMTGWGGSGAMAQRAGHDINYVALSGALHSIGQSGGPPVPPLNLLGDYGAGGMMLVVGILSAVLHAKGHGEGQVLDVAMVDGLAAMLAPFHALQGRGVWSAARGENMLDGGAPYYGVYETSDGRHMAVGAVEAKFHAEVLDVLGLDRHDLDCRQERAEWPAARGRMQSAFHCRTMAEWTEVFAEHDCCVTPVLDLEEAREHELAASRAMFETRAGIPQPSPAPRFSVTPLSLPQSREPLGASTEAVLLSTDRSAADVADLRDAGVVR